MFFGFWRQCISTIIERVPYRQIDLKTTLKRPSFCCAKFTHLLLNRLANIYFFFTISKVAPEETSFKLFEFLTSNTLSVLERLFNI